MGLKAEAFRGRIFSGGGCRILSGGGGVLNLLRGDGSQITTVQMSS